MPRGDLLLSMCVLYLAGSVTFTKQHRSIQAVDFSCWESIIACVDWIILLSTVAFHTRSIESSQSCTNEWYSQHPEFCFYTGGRGCRHDSVHIISHELYSNTISYNEGKAIDFLLLIALRWIFLLATQWYQDTLNLFHVHLMAICKENHLNW